MPLDAALDNICQHILEVAPGLHSAGTFSARTFEAIRKAAQKLQIRNSVETGSGASTLLFSHMSEHHTVFALDDGTGSVRNVRQSPLLRRDAVTFVEGPTQVTLPQHRFTEKLQVVLIDGPHGYPFPDLEYYYLYPHLETGALLVLDDIHIPTVHNLFEFLRRDAMFDLQGVVRRTAFFTRTGAPTFDQFGDGWWRQKYNARPLLRHTWREEIKRFLPTPIQRSVARMQRQALSGSSQAKVEILAPRSGATVADVAMVEGSARMPPDSFLWVLARRKDFQGWWPQGAGAVLVDQNRWRVSVTCGGPDDKGSDFEVAALVVRQSTNDLWTACEGDRFVSSGSVASCWLCLRRGISNCDESSVVPAL
jgi:hypothetical protein